MIRPAYGADQPPTEPGPFGGGYVDATPGMARFGYRGYGPLKEKRGFIVHHTGPYPDQAGVEFVQKVYGQRQLPAHYVVDRAGQIYQTLPDNTQGRHIKGLTNLTALGRQLGLNNGNTIGVEVLAKDDQDVTDAQLYAVNRLRSQLGFRADQVYGHGEINSHKMRDEGHRAAAAIRLLGHTDDT